MSDISLPAISVSSFSTSLAETKDSIKWYSWLAGYMATAIVMAAMVSSQNFPLLLY
jgi:uncharacterized membrane protein YdcZ (DUF606 family)